jgi:hypothetical protein
MEAGFIFTADWHPESDGLTHFRDDPDQEPDSAPFDPGRFLQTVGPSSFRSPFYVREKCP